MSSQAKGKITPPWKLLLLLPLLWAVLSASLELLLLAAGVISVVIVMGLEQRLRRTTARDSAAVATYRISPLRLPGFLLWLLVAIVKSNLQVMRIAFTRGKLRPPAQMIRVPASQRSVAGRVLHANAITLTPGTVSVEVQDDSILVHSLFGDAPELMNGSLDKRICNLERPA